MSRRGGLLRFGDDDRGSAILELVVMVPFFILLLLGTVEIGTYMYDGIEVANAARAGVQYGAQSLTLAGDTTGIANAAVADAKDIKLATGNVTSATMCTCDFDGTVTSCSGASTCSGSLSARNMYLSDTVTMTFVPIVAFPGLPSSLSIVKVAKQVVTP